jgi:hypothetical protein
LKSRKLVITIIGVLFFVLFILDSGIYIYEERDKRLAAYELLGSEMANLLSATTSVMVQQFLKSKIPITASTVGFLPGSMIYSIADNYTARTSSGILFNNVSDNPQNPLHRASPLEMGLIDYFQKYPQAKGHMQEVLWRGSDYLHYGKPVIMEKVCLKCHDSKDSDAHIMLEQYLAGANYPEGSVRGAINVYMPKERIDFAYWESVVKHLVATFLILMVAFLLCVGVLIKYWPADEVLSDHF